LVATGMPMMKGALEYGGRVLALGTSRLSPWWRFRLYHYLHKGLLGDPYWCASAPETAKWTRVRPHGYEMELSGADWMERYALHTGTFYSGEVIATVMTEVGPGDCVVDVGANIGFVTLAASRRVGRHGKVFTIEPNPTLVDRLHRTVARNQISNVQILPFAAGDRNADVGFSQDSHHGNDHILMDVASAPKLVAMRRLDDLIGSELPKSGVILAKLDIEGAEMMALRGMPNLIHRRDVVFLIEVSDERLRQHGGSAEALFDMMRCYGYSAFVPSFPPFSASLRARPVNGLHRKRKTYDILFRHSSSRA